MAGSTAPATTRIAVAAAAPSGTTTPASTPDAVAQRSSAARMQTSAWGARGTNKRQTVKSQSMWERMRRSGMRTFLVESSWPVLIGCLFGYYAVGGALLGALLCVAAAPEARGVRGIFANDNQAYLALADADTLDHADVHDIVLVAVVWWYRGMFCLLLSVSWQPLTVQEHLIAAVGCVGGSVASLLLFGVIYDKFASRVVPIKFAGSVMVRRIPTCFGGHAQLVFRYFNVLGSRLINPQIRLSVVRRTAAVGGGGYVYQQKCAVFAGADNGDGRVDGLALMAVRHRAREFIACRRFAVLAII